MKHRRTNKLVCYKIKGYLKSARLESILVSSTFLPLAEWYYSGDILIKITLLPLFSLSLLTTAGSWQNYVFDIEVDKKAGKNIDFFKYISPKEMLFSSILLVIAGTAILYYVSPIAFIIGVIESILFLTYSAPPVRFKAHPFFDILANMLVFGTLPFLIGFTIIKNSIPIEVILLSLTLGLLAGSYYLFISSFEIETDKKAGIKNTGAIFGFNKTINIAIFFFFTSLILYILQYNISNIVILAGYIITLPLVLFLKITKKIQIQLLIVSLIFLLWNGAVLLLLSLFTGSVLSISLFTLTFIILVMVIYTYIVTKV